MINKEFLIKRIVYRSTHRGIKEMDILLGNFVKKNINKLNDDNLIDLDNLLSLDDETIMKWYLKKKSNKAKKNQKLLELKEIKLRPGTEIHDYNFKIKNSQKFLSKGNKVKFTVKFKGREMQHHHLGMELMNRIIEDTKKFGKVELNPKFEGRQMTMVIQPL